MNNGSIYIGVFLIALCIIPLLLLWRGRKKKENKIRTMIASNANKNNCELNKVDITANMAIGIDETKKQVFFYKKEGESEINQFVDLTAVSDCKVDKSMYSTAASGIVDRLELLFYYKSKTNNPTSFKFYSKDNSSQLNNELLLINHWQTYITQMIKSK